MKRVEPTKIRFNTFGTLTVNGVDVPTTRLAIGWEQGIGEDAPEVRARLAELGQLQLGDEQ